MVLFHHSMFSPLLDESCLFFHTSCLCRHVLVSKFWFYII
jgi:hypothetical protein